MTEYVTDHVRYPMDQDDSLYQALDRFEKDFQINSSAVAPNGATYTVCAWNRQGKILPAGTRKHSIAGTDTLVGYNGQTFLSHRHLFAFVMQDAKRGFMKVEGPFEWSRT